MANRVTTELDMLSARLRVLPRTGFAIFFAYWGERLFPLYKEFSHKHLWGDPTLLRNSLESVWQCLASGVIPTGQGLLASLANIIPDGEHFDSPDSTFAQDSVICVDAALRALTPGESIDSRWIDYVLEPFECLVSIEKTGFVSEGSEGYDSWKDMLILDSRIIEVLKDSNELLKYLESMGHNKIPHAKLRSEAQSKQCNPKEFFRGKGKTGE